MEQYARLPEEKLAALRELIASWRHRRWCSRAQLESLIGHLHHAAKVIWPGRTSEFHLDLQWWHEFLSVWHGVSFWLYPGLSPAPDLEVSRWLSGFWGQRQRREAWAPCQSKQSIAYKELFPVIIASRVWGPGGSPAYYFCLGLIRKPWSTSFCLGPLRFCV